MATLHEITGNSQTIWGGSNGTDKQRIAQKWVADVTATITEVSHLILKQESPTDDVTLTIYKGGETPQAGESQGTSVVNGSGFPSSGTTRTAFAFSPAVAITNGETYWFVWTRATLNSTNKYNSSIINTGSDARVYVPSDGGWESFSPSQDMDIQVDGEAITFIPKAIIF